MEGGPIMKSKRLDVPNLISVKHRPNPYNVVVGLLLVAVMVAAAIEPPTAYLVPLVVVCWLVVFWSYRRETKPRYRRH